MQIFKLSTKCLGNEKLVGHFTSMEKAKKIAEDRIEKELNFFPIYEDLFRATDDNFLHFLIEAIEVE